MYQRMPPNISTHHQISFLWFANLLQDFYLDISLYVVFIYIYLCYEISIYIYMPTYVNRVQQCLQAPADVELSYTFPYLTYLGTLGALMRVAKIHR